MTVRAVVVGSLVTDLAFAVPRRPGAGEVVTATGFGRYRGGKGYDQAVALARLGAEVSMVGAVGKDVYGDDMIAALEREGVDVGRVVQLRGVATSVSLPLVTPDGHVGFVQYPGANRQLAPAHVADLPDCDVLLLQGEVAATTSSRAARVLRGRGAQVVLKPAPPSEMTTELLGLATVVVPSAMECRALLADRPGAPPPGVEAAEALRAPDQVVVVTLGERGAAYAGPDDHGEVPPPPLPAVDRTGAGDSFCAALSIALVEGAPLREAVRFACAAGAYAASVRGAEPGMPRREDVEDALALEA